MKAPDDAFDPYDRPPPPPELEMALAARALVYTRAFASPIDALCAYIFAADSVVSESFANQIPWSHEGPHPRVVTEDGRLWVGWAPLAVVAAAMETHSSEDAVDLRRFPASNSDLWTVVYVRTDVTIARVSPDDLLAVDIVGDRATIPPSVAIEPGVAPAGPYVFDSFSTRCRYTADRAHDGLGPRYVTFRDDGQLDILARTCSRCEQNSVVA